ncbi:hypothetical protein HGI47_18480 [Novosphingobium sp. ERN07]|uniref:hypothetical protein n=1 Tax=Novosphingobium sp. ERN07 TaxID=2726187 RepID=UPI0014563838|nr:hypothetical protein [Novosphingobium sp. ERN07]NLR72866.1 hypothetical protein [Novosphingobium sp. ERN07]
MNDPRKPIFDAVRAAARPGLFNDPGNVLALDNLLDAFDVKRPEKNVAPDPAADPIPAGYFDILAKIESGNRPFIKASTSTASGLYQFIRSTWLGEGGAWGGNAALAFGGLRPPVEEQTARARSFTLKNARYLQAQGIPINAATLYAAHFFGAGTAAKVLKAADRDRADLLAGTQATAANPSILRGKSVAEFKAWLQRKTGASA